MRQLKFRGKIDGVWWYVTPDDDHKWEQFWRFVDKQTVGQCMSLRNESEQIDNDLQVYEGDILEDDETRVIVEFSDAYRSETGGILPPGFRLHRMRYKTFLGEVHAMDDYLDGWWEDPWTVIGNIHDNPELLEER